MTREETISMARKAGLGTALCHNSIDGDRIWIEGADWHDEVERFAALVAIKVAASEREWMQETNIKLIAEAVSAEREACANEVRGYFAAARFDNRSLGLGDVRVTVGDADDLARSICKNSLQVGTVNKCLTVEAAVKAEREACAKVCEDIFYENAVVAWCAKAIRDRGVK